MEIDYKKLISESTAPFFTRQNLEVLLGNNRRTLDYRIRSLIKAGLLDTIKPGFYLNETLYQKSSAPEELARYIGCEIVRDSYISLEYALALLRNISRKCIYHHKCDHQEDQDVSEQTYEF